ncbi:hypothetical protein [Deinococcus ficus]|uniref:hypothetical protein n=1 Tax=Deinococcus ficus TaxID=317577 RepID=UPI00174E5C96|nr:hypothetical protein [Deinococcus ficus]GHF79897.1 hypothetical protein GCM10017782_17270 [Deinococcus ficus]
MPELQFTCEHCNQPIEPAEGALFITNDELQKAESFIQNATAATGTTGDAATDLLNFVAAQQQRGQYQSMHDSCSNSLNLSTAYAIELTRLSTYGDLLAWNAHLQEKRWQAGTNFAGIMISKAPALPS